MKKLYAKIKRYWYMRNWKKIKTFGLGIDPYDFPSIYLAQIDRGFTDQDLTNRNAPVYTRFADIGEVLQYLESISKDITEETISNRLSAPGKASDTNRGRVMRADAFMYNSHEDGYVTMTEVMRRLQYIYGLVRIAERERNHFYHHRTRSFVRPVIDQLHEIFVETLK